MVRAASSSKPMLIATETRKASVQGTFRKPSTKRSEVVNPTSNKPPTISHNQGMNFLSLDATQSRDIVRRHGEAANYRQHDYAVALHRLLLHVLRRCPRSGRPVPQPGAGPHGRL